MANFAPYGTAKTFDGDQIPGVAAEGAGILYTDRRQFYIEPNTYKELWTSVTPFLSGLMERGQTRSDLMDPMFKMFQHAEPWGKQELVTSTAATIANDDVGVSFVFTSHTGLPHMTATAQTDSPYIGLVFEIWTSDYLTKRGVAICTATHASNADTLTFKNLGTTAITTVSGDKFVLQSHLSGTGQTAPNAWSDELSVVWNSTGITRIAVEIEGTLYRAALRGATNELERLRKQKMRQHKIWEERKLLRGMSVLGTNLDGNGSFADTWRTDASTKKIRSTLGLITALELYGESSSAEDDQNVFDFTAGCDYNQWIEATEKIWQYLPESGVRDFYCGPKALSFWSKIDEQGKTRTGFQIQLSDMRSDTLGVYFKYLETPFGLSRLIYTPALRREYNNIMLAATPENLFHAIYAPTTYYTNIKTENNYDGIKDEYYSDTGIGITLIESHSLVKMPKN